VLEVGRLSAAMVIGKLFIQTGVAVAFARGDELSSTCQTLGSCESVEPAREHQLLQLSRHSALVKAPGQFDTNECKSMTDVKKTCSQNSCKVLADGMQNHRTCREYCSDQLMDCVGAWEDEGDHCHNPKATLTCDDAYDHTSDLLCECAPSVDFRAKMTRPSGRLVWSDEFEGTELDSSKWNIVHAGGGFGNKEKQFYRGENAKLADGVLSIEAKCEDYDGDNYTSSKLHTQHKGDWGPGHRVEVRARLPKGKGVWPAIWMLPSTRTSSWPRCGEIDIIESVGCTQDKVYGTIHTEAYNHMHHTEKSRTMDIDGTEWHTYSIDWTEAGLTWFVDGESFHRFAPSAKDVEKWPFDQEFYLILNVAVGGSWGGMCVHNAPSCSTDDEFGHSQVMQVDFARVYEI